MPEGKTDRQLARLVPAVPDKDALAVTYLAGLSREPAERRRVLDALRQGHGEAPPGSASPTNTSTSAWASSWPPNQHWTSAAARAAKGTVTGDPVFRTTTVLELASEHPLDQFLLLAGQVHARAVVALALPIVVGADDDNGHIGAPGDLAAFPIDACAAAPVPASSFSRASRHPAAKATSTSGPGAGPAPRAVTGRNRTDPGTAATHDGQLLRARPDQRHLS